MDICETKGISWPIAAPDEFLGNAWVIASPEREQEIVYMGHMDDNAWIDSSQQAHRSRPSNEADVCATVLPGCHFYNYQFKRFLIGRDLMNLQAYPWPSLPNIANFSERELADLAGNAFTGTVSLALDVCILMNLKYGGANIDDDVSMRMQALTENADTQDFDWSD